MEDELDVVECAVRRVLDQELSTSGDNAGEKIELLRRLIEEVHVARARSRRKKSSSEALDNAAVRAAEAAANAAQAAAESVTKNAQMIQMLLETLRSQRMDLDDNRGETTAGEDDAGEGSLEDEKEISRVVKNLERQNVITHFILAFIVITTAIWRIKEITWITRVRRMLSNPLETVGEILSGDHHQEQQRHHKQKEEADKPLLPRLELPQIFQKNEVTESSSPSATSKHT